MNAYPVKPTSGGQPLNGLYRQLASSPDWVQEAKLDGVRAYWDGFDLWSRTGNKLPRCEEVKAVLPRGIPFDGEIVYGLEGPVFWLFDMPGLPEGQAYTQRRATLEHIYKGFHDKTKLCIKLTPYVTWDDVERLSLEGVVFKKRDSRYEMAHRAGVKTASWVKFVARLL